MDHIDEFLASKILEADKYELPIITSMRSAKDTLNKYYDRTDHSELYRIAMSKSNMLYYLQLTRYPQYLILPKKRATFLKQSGRLHGLMLPSTWHVQSMKGPTRVALTEIARLATTMTFLCKVPVDRILCVILHVDTIN